MKQGAADLRAYSGERSNAFWDRVKAVESDTEHAALYALGCVLQELEERVLRQLEAAEAKAKEHKT